MAIGAASSKFLVTCVVLQQAILASAVPNPCTTAAPVTTTEPSPCTTASPDDHSLPYDHSADDLRTDYMPSTHGQEAEARDIEVQTIFWWLFGEILLLDADDNSCTDDDPLSHHHAMPDNYAESNNHQSTNYNTSPLWGVRLSRWHGFKGCEASLCQSERVLCRRMLLVPNNDPSTDDYAVPHYHAMPHYNTQAYDHSSPDDHSLHLWSMVLPSRLDLDCEPDESSVLIKTWLLRCSMLQDSYHNTHTHHHSLSDYDSMPHHNCRNMRNLCVPRTNDPSHPTR
jgi:hypothetical protein